MKRRRNVYGLIVVMPLLASVGMISCASVPQPCLEQSVSNESTGNFRIKLEISDPPEILAIDVARADNYRKTCCVLLVQYIRRGLNNFALTSAPLEFDIDGKSLRLFTREQDKGIDRDIDTTNLSLDIRSYAAYPISDSEIRELSRGNSVKLRLNGVSVTTGPARLGYLEREIPRKCLSNLEGWLDR